MIGLLVSCGIAQTRPVTAPTPAGQQTQIDDRFRIGELRYTDNFNQPSGKWITELESGGQVSFTSGRLDIDVPAGATVWFNSILSGPTLIEYEATGISSGGGNDRVSDINCFWMARDSRNPDNLFAIERHGKFAEYNPLLTYYVGLGGNGNTTTRFRRYVGDPIDRPLLPKNDLRARENLIVPNRTQLIQLVACGNLIEYYRDGKRLFEMQDPHPYTSGWFGFRTTKSHVQFRSFKVFELTPAQVSAAQPVHPQ